MKCVRALKSSMEISPNSRLWCERTIGHRMLRCAWTGHTCVLISMRVRSFVHHDNDTLCEGSLGSGHSYVLYKFTEFRQYIQTQWMLVCVLFAV